MRRDFLYLYLTLPGRNLIQIASVEFSQLLCAKKRGEKIFLFEEASGCPLRPRRLF